MNDTCRRITFEKTHELSTSVQIKEEETNMNGKIMEENLHRWIQVKQTPALVSLNFGNAFSTIKINKTKCWFKLISVSMFNHYHLFAKRQQHKNGFLFAAYSNYSYIH